ncbi:MAG TPA: Sb-PDE family phosphodiesterase, partial [Rhodothermales bacterium]
PDIPGYQTLTMDLHLHTVFSDGSVWPSIRVEEAIRDGLDAIAITDHLEYQPHRADIPNPDRNRSFDIAREVAASRGLIVIRGSEITRSMPPGHANAIFIQDANPILTEDPLQAFREAKRQGAFVFWNHPMWTAQRSDGVSTLTDMHRQLLTEGLLDGIEVVNDHSYSEEALQIAMDHDLTIMGSSDIHGLIDWEYGVPEGGHRPVTLVFATARTEAAIREALDARRTAVWHNDLLVGREEWVRHLVEASLRVASARYLRDTEVLEVMLENVSDAPFVLRYTGQYTFDTHAEVVSVPPNGTARLLVRTVQRQPETELSFDVQNAVVAPGRTLELSLTAMAEVE